MTEEEKLKVICPHCDVVNEVNVEHPFFVDSRFAGHFTCNGCGKQLKIIILDEDDELTDWWL